jgi:hypothetical protein
MPTRLSLPHSERNLDPAQIDERIRERAYEIYQERGFHDDHALEDWLVAKAEVLHTMRKPKAA